MYGLLDYVYTHPPPCPPTKKTELLFPGFRLSRVREQVAAIRRLWIAGHMHLPDVYTFVTCSKFWRF